MLTEHLTWENGCFVWPRGEVDVVRFEFAAKKGDKPNSKRAWFMFDKERFKYGNPRFEPSEETPKLALSFYDNPFGQRNKRAVLLEL